MFWLETSFSSILNLHILKKQREGTWQEAAAVNAYHFTDMCSGPVYRKTKGWWNAGALQAPHNMWEF